MHSARLESSLFKSLELENNHTHAHARARGHARTHAGGKVTAGQGGGHSYSANPRENSPSAPERENRDVPCC